MIRSIGSHVVLVEEELVTLRLHGALSLEEMRAVTGIIDEVIARVGRCGVLGDLRALTQVTPEARRFAGSWTNVDFCYATGVFGASLPLRTIVSLLSRAIELFRKRPQRGALQFWKTEEEARAWVLSRRRELFGK